MKAKLLLPVVRVLVLAAIAASLVSCGSSGAYHSEPRTADPFLFQHHRFHNHHCNKL